MPTGKLNEAILLIVLVYERSVTREIEDVPVSVASIDDLITMKRLAGRDIDQSDIRQLQQIKEMPGDYT